MTATAVAARQGDVVSYVANPPSSCEFDAPAWLVTLTKIGGGFALTSSRRLAFIVDQCDAEDLAIVMAHMIGRPDRQEAVKRAIEQRQNGEA